MALIARNTTAAESDKQCPRGKDEIMHSSTQIFVLPDQITGSEHDRSMGRAMIDAWRRDGVLQIASSPEVQRFHKRALEASRHLFYNEKENISSQSYSGCTQDADGPAGGPEVLAIAKEPPLPGSYTEAKYSWPNNELKPVGSYMERLGLESEKLLRLVEYGLGIPERSFRKHTRDEWHSGRIIRSPQTHASDGKLDESYMVGPHTDYGLLILASQDDGGGLFIRPQYEKLRAHWDSAGHEGWVYTPTVPNVYTAFLGDMLQYIATGHLATTIAKVGLNAGERLVFAYLHEVELPGHPQASREADRR